MTAPASYAVADRLAAVTDRIGERAAAIWRAVERGELAAETAAELVAIWTELGATQAQALALAEYGGAMAELGLSPSAPTTPASTPALGHLETAARTSISDPGQAAVRLARLAMSETAAAFQRATGELLAADTRITGYRRGLNAGACELCLWLYKDGYVYPTDQPMHRHTGCQCVQEPTTENVSGTTDRRTGTGSRRKDRKR